LHLYRLKNVKVQFFISVCCLHSSILNNFASNQDIWKIKKLMENVEYRPKTIPGPLRSTRAYRTGRNIDAKTAGHVYYHVHSE
jgi:hypothetical protein